MPKNNLIGSSSVERKFQARMDLDTLNRACEIQKDKGRMNAVGALAKEQMEVLSRHVEGSDVKKAVGKASPDKPRTGLKSSIPPGPKRPLGMEPAKKGIPVERVGKSRKV